MFQNCRSTLVASLAIAFTFCSFHQLAAQTDLKTQVAQCIELQKSKFKPLKHESDTVYAKFSSKSGVYYEVIRWLEDNPDTAEAKRQLEIARLESRLEALKEVQAMTTADGIKKLKTTVEDAHNRIEDVKDEQRMALRPVERKRSSLKREFEELGKSVEPVLEGLFRTAGDNELTSELKRSYASFSFEGCYSSGHYKRGDKGSTACMLQIKFVHDEIAKEKLGKLDDKYPIVKQSDTQLEILVGDALVTIYSSDSALKKENLAKAMMGVVDIEKLQSLLPSPSSE